MGINVSKEFLMLCFLHGIIEAYTAEVMVKACITHAQHDDVAIASNDPCWGEIEQLGEHAIIGCRGRANNYNAQRALTKINISGLDQWGNLTESAIKTLLIQVYHAGTLQEAIFQDAQSLVIRNIKREEQGRYTEQLFIIESANPEHAQSRFILKGLIGDHEVESLVQGAEHALLAPLIYPRMEEGYPQIIFPSAYFSYKDQHGRTRHLSLMPVASGYKVVSLRNTFVQKASHAERMQMQRLISETYFEIGAKMARFYRRYAMSKHLIPMGMRHGDFHTGNIFYDPATRKVTLIDNDHIANTIGRAECVWRDFLPMITKVKRGEPMSDHMYSLWFAASAPSFIIGFLSAYPASDQLKVLKELAPCMATYKKGERIRKREQIGVLKEALQALGKDIKDFFYYGDVFRSIKNCIAHRPLVAADVDINSKDAKGMTVLHEMATKESSSLLWTLIAAGADIHARDSNGNTPLHLAVQNKNSDAINTLIQAGATIDSRNRAGMTPLALAAENKEVIKALCPKNK